MEKQKLPHSQNALILGISSIITSCCCNGLPIGLILGIIGMMQAKKAQAIHDENPEQYEGIKNVETGKITSIIGIILGILGLIYMIYLFTSGGWEEQMEQIRQIIEEAQNE